MPACWGGRETVDWLRPLGESKGAWNSVTNPPTQPPTAADLLNDPLVQQALAQAWIDSQAGDSSLRHEEGGWVYLDKTTGQLAIRGAPAGSQAQLDLSSPPHVLNAVVVGTFHTHPNPTAAGWNPGPSSTDQASAASSGVPWLIRADNGDFSTGPIRRRGGLSGNPGYPL